MNGSDTLVSVIGDKYDKMVRSCELYKRFTELESKF